MTEYKLQQKKSVFGHVDASSMARPSSLRPRDSVYPTVVLARDSTFTCSPYLTACVEGLEDCATHLHTAENHLYHGVFDFPRLSKVLESERMSLMVSESTMRLFKNQISDDIEPQIIELMRRGEKAIKLLERRESTVKTKLDALKSRAADLSHGQSTAAKLEAKRLSQLKKQRSHAETQLRTLEVGVEAMEQQLMKQG